MDLPLWARLLANFVVFFGIFGPVPVAVLISIWQNRH